MLLEYFTYRYRAHRLITYNKSLKGYYITAVYTIYGFCFEIWEISVERPTGPKYLRFLYIAAIAQEKNTLPIAKAMLKSWLIEP